MLRTYMLLLGMLLGIYSYGQTAVPDSLSLTLETVTIAVSKPVIEHKADRVVFNVENSTSAAGSDAYELLRRTPGVQVSNTAINISGKDKVSIMINDKLAQVSGEELEAMLRSMISDNISKIEVITTPPARYDAAGNSGIINIVTRKPARQGWNGNISGAYTQSIRSGSMLSGGFSYRSSKWFVYGSAFARKNIHTMYMNNTTYYTQQKQEQYLTQINHAQYNGIELGTDYNISPSATIGLLATYRYRTRDVRQRYHTDVSQTSQSGKDSILYTIADEPFRRSYLNAGIDYDWKIDSGGRRLKLRANYYLDDNNIERIFNTRHVAPDGSPTGYATYRHTAGDQSLGIAAIMADFDLPHTWANMSMGIKASFISNGNGYFTNTVKVGSFAYRENTQAVYWSADRQIGRWQVKLGLRAEYTQTTVASSASTDDSKNSYCKIFPSGYLQYDIAKSFALHINYSRRIERPDFELLNPFRDYSTDVSYFAGNPILQPYTTDNMEIGGTIKNVFNFRIYASHKKDFFTYVSVIDEVQRSFYFTAANTGDCWNYGILLNTILHAGKSWEIMPQVNGYYSSISSDYYNEDGLIGTPSFNVEINNVITLNKNRTLVAELGARYQSAQLRDVELQYPYSVIWGGLKVLMLDRQLTAAINFNDPFNQDYRRSANLYNHTYSRSYYDRRDLRISLSCKFGNKNIKKTERSNDVSSETNRAG